MSLEVKIGMFEGMKEFVWLCGMAVECKVKEKEMRWFDKNEEQQGQND